MVSVSVIGILYADVPGMSIEEMPISGYPPDLGAPGRIRTFAHGLGNRSPRGQWWLVVACGAADQGLLEGIGK